MGKTSREAKLQAAAAARLQAQREDRARLLWILLALAVAFALIGVSYQHAEAKLRLDESISSANCTQICQAIAKYKHDQPDQHVPQTLSELVEHGYLQALPINPYSQAPMRALKVCELSSPGDYSYYPAWILQEHPGAAATRDYTGYYLLVYRSARRGRAQDAKPGWSMDGNVRRLLPAKRILELEIAGYEHGLVDGPPPADASFEPLKDVLLKYEGPIKDTF